MIKGNKDNINSNGNVHIADNTNGETNGNLSDNEMELNGNGVTSTKSEILDKEKDKSEDVPKEKKDVPTENIKIDGDDNYEAKKGETNGDVSKKDNDSDAQNISENKPSSPSAQSDQQSKPTPPVPTPKIVKNKYAYLNKGVTENEELRPVAELLFGLGLNLAKQQVYEDLSRVHKKQKQRDSLSEHGVQYFEMYDNKYESFCKTNAPLTLKLLHCKECSFKTESDNVMQWHLEFAHGQDVNAYQCSFCDFVGKQPGEFFFHMEAEHNRKGRIYMKHAFFSCALCPFENNSRKALIKHQQKCERSFKIKRNLEPAPTDCDIPLKLVKPRVPAAKPVTKPPPITNTPRNVVNQQTSRQQQSYAEMQAKMRQQAAQRQVAAQTSNMLNLLPRQAQNSAVSQMLQQMPIMGATNQHMQIPLYTGVQQMAAAAVSAAAAAQKRDRSAPPPLQKAPKLASNISSGNSNPTPSMPTGAASRFEICEICGGFVKDRESLRIHFYWAHKVDIQKNVFQKKQPHLMCEFCPQRFWTYQGLARHRQIIHSKQATVTSNGTSTGSTHTANKQTNSQNKPQHNCILCGAVNVAHLLNHLSNAHNITLQTMFKQKRCLCCGASFSEEKLLERHMLNSHSDLFRIKPHSKKTPTKLSSPQSIGTNKHVENEKKSVGCPMCKTRFPSSAEFDVHFAKVHSYKCHRCQQVYSSQEMLPKHWHEVHAKETEPCQVCDENVRIGRPYIRHLRSNHLDDFSIKVNRMNGDVVNYLLTRKRPESYSKPMPKFMKLRAEQAPGPKSMKIKAVPSPAWESVPLQEVESMEVSDSSAVEI